MELRDQSRSFVVAVAGLLSDQTRKNKKVEFSQTIYELQLLFLFQKCQAAVWQLCLREELRPLVCSLVLERVLVVELSQHTGQQLCRCGPISTSKK